MNCSFPRKSCWLCLAILALVVATSSANAQIEIDVEATATPLSPAWFVVNSMGPPQPASAQLSATVDDPPTLQADSPCTLSAPEWEWGVAPVDVSYSTDNQTWTEPPNDSYSAWIVQNGATATLYVIYYIGGYWQFPCSIGVAYNDYMGGCQDTWFGTTQAISDGTSVSLTILRCPDGGTSYQTIGGTNADALPGQYINLEAYVLPTNLTATYQWTIPAKTFKNYTANNSTATPGQTHNEPIET
ncbi:MAG TPA: hypothetical protein VMF69_01295 [Gemmataceae bacterium]|nr:hypothetical protein [Gemmataceae bacterium]